MVIAGVILLLISAAVIIYMLLATAGEPSVNLTYGVLNVDMSPVWLFLLGGITLAVATCALWLIGVGAKGKARKAKEVRELRRQAGQDTTRRGVRSRDDNQTAGRTGRTETRGTTTTSTDRDAPILPRPGRDTGTATAPSRQPGQPGPDGQPRHRDSSLDPDR